MTKKGWIYIGFMYEGGNYKHTIQESWRGAHAEGKLVRYADDVENNETLYVIHKKEENGTERLCLSILFKGTLERHDNLLDASASRVSVVMV